MFTIEEGTGCISPKSTKSLTRPVQPGCADAPAWFQMYLAPNGFWTMEVMAIVYVMVIVAPLIPMAKILPTTDPLTALVVVVDMAPPRI